MNTECHAVQKSDQMVCVRCQLVWDMNDIDPPKCEPKAIEGEELPEWIGFYDLLFRVGERMDKECRPQLGRELLRAADFLKVQQMKLFKANERIEKAKACLERYSVHDQNGEELIKAMEALENG